MSLVCDFLAFAAGMAAAVAVVMAATACAARRLTRDDDDMTTTTPDEQSRAEPAAGSIPAVSGVVGSIFSVLGQVLPQLRPAVLAEIKNVPARELREAAGILREFAEELGEVAEIMDRARVGEAPQPLASGGPVSGVVAQLPGERGMRGGSTGE